MVYPGASAKECQFSKVDHDRYDEENRVGVKRLSLVPKVQKAAIPNMNTTVSVVIDQTLLRIPPVRRLLSDRPFDDSASRPASIETEKSFHVP